MGYFWGPPPPPPHSLANSDMDYRIFNMRMWSSVLHAYAHGGHQFTVSSEGLLYLTPEKCEGGRKAQHVTVTHPFGDLAR